MRSYKCESSLLICFLALISISLIPASSGAYDNINVHPYIAEQAFYVWPNDQDHEIAVYLGLDYREPDSNCNDAKQGDKITEGSKEEDDYDPIADKCNNNLLTGFYAYYHHFFNPDIEDDQKNGLYNYPGALYYAKIYWQRALNKYANVSTRGTAYWYLGRIAHLVGDVSVPAHARRDEHLPGNNDSYEDHVTSHYGEWSTPDATNLGSLPEYTTLDDIFNNLAQRAQYFPSDDSDGENLSNTDPSWFIGWPDTSGWVVGTSDRYIESANRQKIGDHMMPLAIQYVAVLYKLFWQEVHPGEVDFTGNPRSDSAPLTVTFMDLSTNHATSWEWDFGDGLMSAENNPVHTYSTPGYFSVTLSATGTLGTIIKTKNNYVNAGACANGHVKIGDSIANMTMQDAYDSLSEGETAQFHAYVFSENLVFQNSAHVILRGGYGCNYSSNPGFTTIDGSLIIKAGAVTLENLIVK